MKRSEIIFGLLRIPLDSLAIVAALLLSFRLREANVDLIPRVQLLEVAQTLPPFSFYVSTFVVPSLVLILALTAMAGLYALRNTLGGWQEMLRMVVVVLLWLVAIMAYYFLVRKELFYSRILLIHAFIFLTLFIGLARVAVLLLQRAFMRNGIGVRKVVSIGVQPVVPEARRTLKQDYRYQYLGHLADLNALTQMQPQYMPDLVIQTDPNPISNETINLINFCRSQHIGYAFLPPVLADVPHQLLVSHLGLIPIMEFKPTPLDGWGRVTKRLSDVILSAIGLVILSPLFLIVSILVFFNMGRPIFYVSKRVGERGMTRIPVFKFRSMIPDADQQKYGLLERNQRNDGPLFKLKDDPRITPLGRFLRRFDIDELPQLLNVFLGHMSLVGPRPHLPEEVERYQPYERRVFTIKPGITGLAQVSGRSDLNFQDEVRLDLRYVEEWTPLMDLWILWRTIVVVFSRSTVD